MEWIKMYKEIICELIKETPPDGNEFLKTVERILQVSYIFKESVYKFSNAFLLSVNVFILERRTLERVEK